MTEQEAKLSLNQDRHNPLARPWKAVAATSAGGIGACGSNSGGLKGFEIPSKSEE